MCLYPKLIINKKYTETKKNKGIVPKMTDERVKYVAVGCQKCIECRGQKSRMWRVRLSEELRTNKDKAHFVTLTFSDESIEKLNKLVEEYAEGDVRKNRIATIGVRYWLERWRKRTGKSVRHWLITELGGENERIHLHGIVWTNEVEWIENSWQYGMVWVGEYVSEKTVNYIVKYVTKVDENNPDFEGKILTSAGIGRGYMDRIDSKRNKYKEEGGTNETYMLRDGNKVNLPIYYRNKIYSEEEREKLWIEKLDKEEIWVMGEKIDVSEDDEQLNGIREYYREKNNRMGYGNDSVNWEKKKYNYIRGRLRYLKNAKKEREKFGG